MADGTHTAIHLVLLAGVAWLCVSALMMPPTGEDLLALWLAATAVAEGAPQLVYADGAVFTLRPDPEWADMALAAGYSGPVFPYLYPPLWAVLLAPITQAMSFAAFSTIQHGVHVAMIGATVWLAWRATGRVVPLPVFLAAGVGIIHLTFAGAVAVSVGQPQIWVAFLTVLAIERLGAGRQASAGAALALAAALKLTPAVFAVAFVARGDWRALLSFAITGGALGGLSIMLGGPALHANFLAQVAAVSNTVIALPLNFSLDSAIAQVLGLGHAIPKLGTTGLDTSLGATGIAEKTPLWSLLSQMALLAVLAVSALGFRRRKEDVLIWPAMIAGVSLVSPLAWGYHFLAALAFAPALMPRWGALPVLGLFVPLTVGLLRIEPLAEPLLRALPVLGAAIMALFALGCVVRPAARRSAPRSGSAVL
ncbi:Protein of unknown function [Palleronia salina]|uniref:Alpha-1,2-mannosyltransferase n=1 Tax=Palleronia salina TaxID=313368 RepID=A0A1M6LEA2_9RHOB|nr:glycosyltransferase family 87 protein [Palleronia salina]SHJ69482.1 Protein of unknown function [Palleronia salina]